MVQQLDKPVPLGEQSPDWHPQGLRQERRVALGRHVGGGASVLDLLYVAPWDTPERLERCRMLQPFLRLLSLTASANMGGHCGEDACSCGGGGVNS